MKSLFCLLLWLLVGCAEKKPSNEFGRMTAAQLLEQKGEPLEKQKIPVEDGQMYTYENNEKYQIQKDIVTHALLEPKGDEQTLLYWKHKFKDCDTSIHETTKAQGHEPGVYELKCDSEGISVVFFEGSDTVSRIIFHEKK